MSWLHRLVAIHTVNMGENIIRSNNIPRPVRATDFSRKSLINFPLVTFRQSLLPARYLLGMKGELQPNLSSNNNFNNIYHLLFRTLEVLKVLNVPG